MSIRISALGGKITMFPLRTRSLVICELLFINHIIAISQQDAHLKITTVMISDSTFNPAIQSGWQIPISSTLSWRSAVIHHLSNKINLFPCPLLWLGAFRQTCHIFQKKKTTTQWRRLHWYSCSKHRRRLFCRDAKKKKKIQHVHTFN